MQPATSRPVGGGSAAPLACVPPRSNCGRFFKGAFWASALDQPCHTRIMSCRDDASSRQPPPGAAAIGRDEAAAHPSSAPAPPLAVPLSTNEHSAAYAGAWAGWVAALFATHSCPQLHVGAACPMPLT